MIIICDVHGFVRVDFPCIRASCILSSHTKFHQRGDLSDNLLINSYRSIMAMKNSAMSRKASEPIRVIMKYSSWQVFFFCVKSKVNAPVVIKGVFKNFVILPTLAETKIFVRCPFQWKLNMYSRNQTTMNQVQK